MYLNKTQLIERGWSPKLITQFLGKADDVHRLGYYCYEHLYFLPRVERVERGEDFISAQEKYLKRRDVGKASAKRRAEQQIEQAKTMRIRVRELKFEDVLDDALFHYNSQNRGRHRQVWNDEDEDYDWRPASRESDELFLERITVNYIRHHLTAYDSKLFAQKGKVGGNRAVPIIRRRVFEEIAIAYPNLSAECDRQMIARELKDASELLPKVLYEQIELPFNCTEKRKTVFTDG